MGGLYCIVFTAVLPTIDVKTRKMKWNTRRSHANALALVLLTSCCDGLTVFKATTRPQRASTQLGLFDWLSSPQQEDDLSVEAAAAFEALCREDGWLVRCQIGSEAARAVGGSGELAKGSSSTAAIDFALSFSRDAGYVPSQGSVNLIRASRFLAPKPGFWKLESDDDDGVPQTVQWRLQTSEQGMRLGDDVLVPPGPMYFNARCEWKEGRLALYDGRLTVKEDVGIDVGLFKAKGILAEFKIVGTFECVARVAAPS
jgi:hypothetical protein